MMHSIVRATFLGRHGSFVGRNHNYLRNKAHQDTKASWGFEARVFLKAHHMSNIYFMVFIMVVSYF